MRLIARHVPSGLEGTAQAIYGTVGIGAATALLTLAAGALYARFGDLSALGRILSGITCAAVGLLIAVVAKMALPLFSKRLDWAPLIAIVAFIGVAILRWPLPYVFLCLAPVSIALAWVRS